jgi:hypothetical protein
VYVDGRQILKMILKNKVNGDWINLAQLTIQWYAAVYMETKLQVT